MGKHAARKGEARHGSDGGATFIEILVSVVLLGVGGVAVLVAATTAVVGARTSDEVAKTQAALVEAVDYLTDTEPENVTYQSCETPGTQAAYQTALDAQFGAGSVQVVSVAYWNQTPPGGFGAACRFASDGDRLQQILLRSNTNGSVREVQVVKRPVEIPTLDTLPAPVLPPYAGGSGQADVSVTPNLP